MRGAVQAIVGSVLVAALSTLGDFVWARYIPAHRLLFGLLLWAAFGVLHGRALGGPPSHMAEALARGGLAAIGSGFAFYAISGIWTRPAPGGPDYSYHFLCWTVAFLPGFLALLVRREGNPRGH